MLKIRFARLMCLLRVVMLYSVSAGWCLFWCVCVCVCRFLNPAWYREDHGEHSGVCAHIPLVGVWVLNHKAMGYTYLE